MPSLCIFGASSTWGAWDTEKGGWANRLRLWIDEKNLAKDDFYLETYNCGVSGDTTADVLDRIDVELAAREPVIVMLSLGDNDSLYRDKPGKHPLTLEQYEQNVRELTKRARKYTDKIIWVGGKHVTESKTMPIPWEKSIYYTNENIQKYDRKLQEVVKAEKVRYLHIFDLLTDADLEDGLHPNVQGHEKIFQRVREFIEKEGLLVT